MRLYQIHDNKPGLDLWPEETTWRAIWANSKEEAFVLYQRHYEGDGITMDDVVFPATTAPAAPAKDSPHVERRDEVLRELGWRLEDERTCDTCGLAAMGLSEYHVCCWCNQCRECGHDQECPERESP